jgi:hypothetical protein
MKHLKKLALALTLLVPAGNVWVGIGAVAAYHGASWQTGVMIGVMGVSDSALYTIALSSVVAFPVSMAVAVGVGL